jgi:hypothetical protein
LAEKERLDLLQGSPPGVLAPEAQDEFGGLPNPDDWDTFVEDFRLNDGERHRVGYSRIPVDFTQLTPNYQELQILDRSKFWVTVLGSVFKVNPSYAGFDFENVNRATDQSQQEAYAQRGFRVTLRQLEESINRNIIWPEFGSELQFEFEREQTIDEKKTRAELVESQASAGKEMANAGLNVSFRDGKLDVEDGQIDEGNVGGGGDGGGFFASVDDPKEADVSISGVRKDVAQAIIDELGEDRFVPPEGAASNAEEALDLIDEHGRDEASGGTEEALGRARQIIDHAENDEPLIGTNDDGVPYVVEIANFFARHRAQGNHEFDSDEYDAKYEDPGWLADMLWGGDAAEEWASSLAEAIDDVEKRAGAIGAFTRHFNAALLRRVKGHDGDGVRLLGPDERPAYDSLVDWHSFLTDVVESGGRIIDTSGVENAVFPPNAPDAVNARMVVYGVDESTVMRLLDRYPIDLEIDTGGETGKSERRTLTKAECETIDRVLLHAHKTQVSPESVDQIEKAAWSGDQSVPEYVFDAIRDAIADGAVFRDFDSIPGDVVDTVEGILEDNLTQAQGWSLDSIVDDMSKTFPGVDTADIEAVTRTEVTSVLSTAREKGYERRGQADGDDVFYWEGADDSRITDACKELLELTNPRHGGTPRPLDELIELEKRVHDKHFPELDFRRHVIHPNERKTFVRDTSASADIDIDVDVPSAADFNEGAV